MATNGILSGSTNGKYIPIIATGTPGTLIHTAIAAIDRLDRVYLYAVNNHTAAVTVTVEFGDTTAATNVVLTIPSKSGKYVLLNGDVLQNALTANVFASVTAVVACSGYVLRSEITETF
ncbi:MAG TPA: hypothetical protein ENI67_04715 [Gammaproteobacteria bacterium]|nr:hypothetical protein [Gammaproteobacteria bacterium]